MVGAENKNELGGNVCEWVEKIGADDLLYGGAERCQENPENTSKHFIMNSHDSLGHDIGHKTRVRGLGRRKLIKSLGIIFRLRKLQETEDLVKQHREAVIRKIQTMGHFWT